MTIYEVSHWLTNYVKQHLIIQITNWNKTWKQLIHKKTHITPIWIHGSRRSRYFFIFYIRDGNCSSSITSIEFLSIHWYGQSFTSHATHYQFFFYKYSRVSFDLLQSDHKTFVRVYKLKITWQFFILHENKV